jgi:hypothetical protein
MAIELPTVFSNVVKGWFLRRVPSERQALGWVNSRGDRKPGQGDTAPAATINFSDGRPTVVANLVVVYLRWLLDNFHGRDFHPLEYQLTNPATSKKWKSLQENNFAGHRPTCCFIAHLLLSRRALSSYTSCLCRRHCKGGDFSPIEINKTSAVAALRHGLCPCQAFTPERQNRFHRACPELHGSRRHTCRTEVLPPGKKFR